MKNLLVYCFILLLASSCAVSRNYSPATKHAPQDLQEDFQVFRNVLEESHPSLYWFTSKDSVDHYFEKGKNLLTDSLREYQFRNVLSLVLSQIRCGHTTVRPSKAAVRYSEKHRGFNLPLYLKLWPDTAVLTNSPSRKDSLFTRGVIVTSIDGRPMNVIVDSLKKHLSTDGYNETHKYQTLSNSGVFRNYYANIYGLKQKVEVGFLDSTGKSWKATLEPFKSVTDSGAKSPVVKKAPQPKHRKKLYREAQRSLRIDTALNTAFLEINSFTKKNRLRSFFKSSFRKIEKQKIENLVIDMRGNGGGSVILSNLLTSYLAKESFSIADSLYAIRRYSKYSRYESQHLLNKLFMTLLTKKKSDGRYHFSYFENREFKPRQKHHFDGKVYILTGGNTFSAATLFAKAIEEQENVVIVGEETGGGAYGNSAWIIPDITLPNTGVRFRLPLFRLVIDSESEKGRGLMPDVEAGPTVEAIRNNRDYKMDKVIEIIREDLKKD